MTAKGSFSQCMKHWKTIDEQHITASIHQQNQLGLAHMEVENHPKSGTPVHPRPSTSASSTLDDGDGIHVSQAEEVPQAVRASVKL